MNYRGAQSEAENLEDLPETHHPSPPETGAASFGSPPDMGAHDSVTADDLLGEIEGTTREDRSDSIDAPQAFHADASASRSQSVSNSSAEDDIDNNDDLADFDPQAIRSPGISPPTAPGSVTGLQGMGNTGYTPQVQKPSMLSRFRAAFSSAISSVARAVGKVIDAVASRPVQSGPERVETAPATLAEPSQPGNAASIQTEHGRTVDPITDELREETHEAAQERTAEERGARSLSRSRSLGL